MADLIDRANQLAEIDRLIAIQAVPRPSARSAVCLNCGEDLKDRFNFCDVECRDDHERTVAAGRRSPHIAFSLDKD